MTCEHCGAELEIVGFSKRKFCNDKCRSQYHNAKRKKTKLCVICGTDTTTKYCSESCRKKGRLKKAIDIANKMTKGFELSEKSRKEIIDYILE